MLMMEALVPALLPSCAPFTCPGNPPSLFVWGFFALFLTHRSFTNPCKAVQPYLIWSLEETTELVLLTQFTDHRVYGLKSHHGFGNACPALPQGKKLVCLSALFSVVRDLSCTFCNVLGSMFTSARNAGSPESSKFRDLLSRRRT